MEREQVCFTDRERHPGLVVEVVEDIACGSVDRFQHQGKRFQSILFEVLFESGDVDVVIARNLRQLWNVPLVDLAALTPDIFLFILVDIAPQDPKEEDETACAGQVIDVRKQLVEFVEGDLVSHGLDLQGVIGSEVHALFVQPEVVHLEQVIVDQPGDQDGLPAALVVRLSASSAAGYPGRIPAGVCGCVSCSLSDGPGR